MPAAVAVSPPSPPLPPLPPMSSPSLRHCCRHRLRPRHRRRRCHHRRRCRHHQNCALHLREHRRFRCCRGASPPSPSAGPPPAVVAVAERAGRQRGASPAIAVVARPSRAWPRSWGERATMEKGYADQGKAISTMGTNDFLPKIISNDFSSVFLPDDSF